jgi:protein O-GlcNAc transferase
MHEIEQGWTQLRAARSSDALRSFQLALQLRPGSIEAAVGATSALLRLGRLRDAMTLSERALQLAPTVAEVQANAAAVYLASKRPGPALACCESALRLRADFFEAQFNRGEALLALGRPAAAIDAYDRALALRPRFAAALCGRGHAHRGLGDRERALENYQQALAVDPQLSPARVGHLLAQIPVIPESQAQLEASRLEFAAELDRLERWLAAQSTVNELAVVGVSQPFQIAYQERPNRELLARWGSLCARQMQQWASRHRWPAQHDVPKEATAGIRLGIVSAQLREHSVYRALIRGWMEQLDAARVRISVFHLAPEAEPIAERIGANTEIVNCSDRTLYDCIDLIRQRRCHALLYPEIGMDPTTVQLASLRLAQHQIAAWGHPETTGLPTIDYYLSASAFEPPAAEQHYSEQLVQLPGIGCYYEPLGLEVAAGSRERLGLAEGVPLLLSAGMPYKYAPEHDGVMAAIARALPGCRIVLFVAQPRELTDRLVRRLQQSFRDNGADPGCLLTVPWQAPQEFFALLRTADVFLDTIGFSGFNTVMQAIECELPVVTIAGRFMRGRFASGVLQMMGLNALIADGTAQYVQIAVRLATDAAFRRSMRARIRRERGVLYCDRNSIDALLAFLAGLAVERT